jgi:hypothetical protein
VAAFLKAWYYAGRLKLGTSDFDDAIQSAMFDLNALAAKHDARALAAACMSKGAYLYQQLRMLELETAESLDKIFALYLQLAQEDGEKARVITDSSVHKTPKGKAN